ncbi:hypothetical protein BKA64DRAFT_635377 [Cadophora sp. MPI-SDFR-AT-0126]|nr:hypothetical protein BKA64DRAFT_635377 [Leotiomycetes sp. MPI-SDFR-AT-0126]
MRFSIAAAAFMATAASAGSIVYLTEEVTITSCAATVTDCPAKSTVTSLTSYPVVTSSSAPAVYPTTYANVSSPAVPTYPAETASASVSVPVYSTSSAIGVPSYPASSSPVLSTITISTCVPTVLYSTVTVTPNGTSCYLHPSPICYRYVGPNSSVISYPHNVTYPAATATPTAFTGAASNVQGSIVMVAFAGLAAFIFA